MKAMISALALATMLAGGAPAFAKKAETAAPGVVGAGSTIPPRRMSSLRFASGVSPSTFSKRAASSASRTAFSVPTAPLSAASASVSSVI